MVTNGVCIAHQIQPMDRKFFPEGWIGKEAIDHLRVICRILRFRELTCCWDRGWKSDEILVYTTSKSCLVRRLGGRMPRDSRSAKMKKSIGLVGQSISLTDGKGGLVMGLNDQWVPHGAPSATHFRMASFSFWVRLFPESGAASLLLGLQRRCVQEVNLDGVDQDR